MASAYHSLNSGWAIVSDRAPTEEAALCYRLTQFVEYKTSFEGKNTESAEIVADSTSALTSGFASRGSS